MFNKAQVAAAYPAKLDATTPLEGAGTIIHRTKGLLKAVADFSVQGGAAGSYGLLDDQGNPAILPPGAIVTNVVAVVVTAAAGGTTIALKLLTAADLMAATATASLTLAAVVAGAPVGTAATWVGPVTSATGTQINSTLVGTYTAYKINYFIEFVIS